MPPSSSMRYVPLIFGLLINSCALAGNNLWGAHLDVEAKPGNKRSLGEADMFLPVFQDSRTLLFANVRTRTDDVGGREGNFGLGARHMLENGWNLGTYGYFDRRRSSDTGFYYNQATLGLEALGPDFEWRTNAYVPLGTRSRNLGPEITTASVVNATVQVQTNTSQERSLGGFDVEGGWRLPLFDSNAARQLRVYLGGYHFSDSDMTVTGPRARLELAFEDLQWFGSGSALFLGVEAQHDSKRGSQQFLTVRLRIPLGQEHQARSSLSGQARRMTAATVRDVDVVTQRYTARQTETTATTADGKNFTVVDSATTSGSGLPAAVASGNSIVLLAGTFNTSSSVVVKDNQTLTGNLTVRTASGRTAMVNTQGAIQASNASGGGVVLGTNSVLSNLKVVNNVDGSMVGYGVSRSTFASGFSIINSQIQVSQSGANDAVGINIGANGLIIISNNNISVTGSAGSGTLTAVSATQGTYTINGNTLNASGGTANYLISSGAVSLFRTGSTGNSRINGVCDGFGASGHVAFTDGSTCP